MPIPAHLSQKLKDLVQADINARHIFRQLATRQKPHKDMDLYRVKLVMLKGGVHMSDEQLHKIFEKLERFGVGKLKKQRLPKHSTFSWDFAVRDVVQLALESSAASDMRLGSSASSGTKPSASQMGLRVFCPLRSGLLPLSLPTDFGRRDAEAIAAFLELVAIENESR